MKGREHGEEYSAEPVRSHQLHKHDDQQRRRHDSADEDALLIEVGLLCKALPMPPQEAVDVLRIVHYTGCRANVHSLTNQ